jgi:hypothetical protein
MKKVLITGIGVGKEFGACDANNMNYEELLVNPQTLLWADKICVPSTDFFPNTIIGNEARLVYSILENEKLIYKYNANDIDYDSCYNSFLDQAISELKSLEELDTDSVSAGDRNNVPFETIINGNRYCAPRIAAINASILVAEELNAVCLFDKSEEEYLKFRYDITSKAKYADSLNMAYKDLFACSLPNESILHHYGLHKGCNCCVHSENCSDTYLNDVEKNLYKVLSLRNRDEMKELAIVMDSIIQNADEYLEVDETDYILKELRKKQFEINKLINLDFPKVQRFANLVANVSIPLSICGPVVGSMQLSTIGSVALGTASLINNTLERYKNKTSWVRIVDKNNYGKC